MKLFNEKFTEEKLNEVIDFMDDVAADMEKVWGWDTSRFVDWYWGSNSLRENKSCWYSENCQIFLHNNKIAALLISEEGGDDFCILTKERNPLLVRSVLKWLIEHKVGERESICFEISDSELWLSEIFQKEGFIESKNSGHEWEYDLSEREFITELPEGYTVETLVKGDNEAIRGIASVIKEAFHSGRSVEDIMKVLMNLFENPKYQPELSVYVQSPSGKVVAYCRGTVNHETGVCAIDPVCCHPEYHRKGLAKAVVTECFRRQKRLGGRFSYIGSAPIPSPSTYLYRSLQPFSYTTCSLWKRSLEK